MPNVHITLFSKKQPVLAQSGEAPAFACIASRGLWFESRSSQPSLPCALPVFFFSPTQYRWEACLVWIEANLQSLHGATSDHAFCGNATSIARMQPKDSLSDKVHYLGRWKARSLCPGTNMVGFPNSKKQVWDCRPSNLDFSSRRLLFTTYRYFSILPVNSTVRFPFLSFDATSESVVR